MTKFDRRGGGFKYVMGGGGGFVVKCGKGRGLKMAKNPLTVFVNGP